MNGECGMDLAQSETPCVWRSPLYGTWEISLAPGLGSGRFKKATSRTLNMYVGEKSDWAIVPKKRDPKQTKRWFQLTLLFPP